MQPEYKLGLTRNRLFEFDNCVSFCGKINNEIDVAECEKALSKSLGRGVRIVNGKRKGRFELEFYGQDDLQILLDALMKLSK